MGARWARFAVLATLLCGQVFAKSEGKPDANAYNGDDLTGSEAPVELEPIAVTGTRIRGGNPDHLPLSTLDRGQLEATGAFRLSEALRRLPWNNLGAQDQGFNVNGRSTLGFVDLRGAGANRTLVLVNGRRLVLSPEANGEVANINNLPLAAVERVEVLRDGASSVYGSDAIGGVVNIILRDHFEGWEAGIGFSQADWGGDEQRYTLSGGRSGARGQFLWSLESRRRDSIHAADGLADPSELIRPLNPTGEPGTWALSDWFGDGSLVPGPWNAEDDCPPERRRQLPPWVAINPATGLPVTPQLQSLCALKFSQTHDFAPASDADHLFLRGTWEPGPGTQLFGQVLYTRLESAMALTAGGDLPNAIGLDNPINPSWDPELGRARSPVTVYFGLFQLGERQRETDSRYLGLLLGGVTRLGRGELEYGVQHDEDRYSQTVANLALRDALREAISQNLFNPFESYNDPVLVVGLRYTQRNRSETQMSSADLTWRADWPGVLAGDRGLSTVAGLEVRHESFEHVPDPEDVALNVFGFLPGGIEADADREVTSAFFEAGLDPTSRTQIVYSARYDRYELPETSETTHKLSFSWQPVDSLTARAGWGQGFRAPSLVELFAPQVPSLTFAVFDRLKCRSIGFQPGGPLPSPIECFPVALPSFEAANADLEPERSENWSLGFVWSPFARLRLEVDYWNVEVEDRITTPSSQEILDLEAVGMLPPGSSVLRDAGGFARQVTRGRLNVPQASIRGVDVALDGSLATVSRGEFRLYSWWSFLESYEVQTLPTSPVTDRVGGPDAPRWKSRSGMGWSRARLDLELTVNGVAGFGSTNNRLAEWWSYDAQVAWSTPWEGMLVAGARNLTDLQPGTYDVRHHDYGGRTWYLRYRQSF